MMSTPGDAATGPGDEAVRRWFAARKQAEARRDAVLASAVDRERVCSILNGAFGEGRLTSAELNQRTSQALTARTHGQLEHVLHGLAAPGSSRAWNARPERGIAARLVFWGVGFFTFPFVFMGSILFLFGDDLGARIGGIVMLVIFLPGLIALHR